jgi:hypothetical protein
MSHSERMAQLYPQAPASLSVSFYDSLSYGGGILTCIHTEMIDKLIVRNIRIFVRNTEEKRHVWNPGHGLEDIIKTDLTELRV